jgi:predicted adenine nucleotide alpha hydrolase (AANH) superfamily ATPase
VAQERGFDYFATTLTISPHKNARIINRVGQRVARELRTKFYPADFKKGDGFKKSCQLSRKYGLYRQDYCGCIYSLREREERKAGRSDSTRAGARGDV